MKYKDLNERNEATAIVNGAIVIYEALRKKKLKCIGKDAIYNLNENDLVSLSLYLSALKNNKPVKEIMLDNGISIESVLNIFGLNKTEIIPEDNLDDLKHEYIFDTKFKGVIGKLLPKYNDLKNKTYVTEKMMLNLIDDNLTNSSIMEHINTNINYKLDKKLKGSVIKNNMAFFNMRLKYNRKTELEAQLGIRTKEAYLEKEALEKTIEKMVESKPIVNEYKSNENVEIDKTIDKLVNFGSKSSTSDRVKMKAQMAAMKRLSEARAKSNKKVYNLEEYRIDILSEEDEIKEEQKAYVELRIQELINKYWEMYPQDKVIEPKKLLRDLGLLTMEIPSDNYEARIKNIDNIYYLEIDKNLDRFYKRYFYAYILGLYAIREIPIPEDFKHTDLQLSEGLNEYAKHIADSLLMPKKDMKQLISNLPNELLLPKNSRDLIEFMIETVKVPPYFIEERLNYIASSVQNMEKVKRAS